MAEKRKGANHEEQILQVVQRARRTLEERGAITSSKLGKAGIRTSVIERLIGEGYEKTKTGVRVKPELQGQQLARSGHAVAVGDLRKRLGGVSATEAKKIAQQLARSGAMHLVYRGKVPTLVPPSERVLEREALMALADQVKQLGDWLKRPRSDRAGASILLSDAQQALAELTSVCASQATTPAPAAPRPALPLGTPSLSQALRGAVMAERDEDSGLASVPMVSRRLRPQASSEDVRAALLEAHEAGEVELRPEGGLGRLSDADAALCPRGANDLPLSWVRLRAEATP